MSPIRARHSQLFRRRSPWRRRCPTGRRFAVVETDFSGDGEGWGLYVEWLGSKIAIHPACHTRSSGGKAMRSPGRAAWSSTRAFTTIGRSRQQAIDYLASHTALSRTEVVESRSTATSAGPARCSPTSWCGAHHPAPCARRPRPRLGPKFDQRWFHLTSSSASARCRYRCWNTRLTVDRTGGPNPYNRVPAQRLKESGKSLVRGQSPWAPPP